LIQSSVSEPCRGIDSGDLHVEVMRQVCDIALPLPVCCGGLQRAGLAFLTRKARDGVRDTRPDGVAPPGKITPTRRRTRSRSLV
jgi:hypothetical protein